jgi:hypothetical protein
VLRPISDPVSPKTKTAILARPFEGDLIARQGSIIIVHHAARVAAEDRTIMAFVEVARRELAREQLGILVILGPEAPAPGPAARRALHDLFSAHGRQIHAIAIAMLGSGFRVAAQRSFVAGMRLLGGSSHPERVFGSVRAAADWLAAHVPGSSADDMADALQLELA